MGKRRSELGDRDEFFRGLAEEIEGFLLDLEADPALLVAYVKDRVGVLNGTDLSDNAKAVLLESDYSVVQEIMRYRESDAIRWLCVWII
jgi:hypothetical protein